jgi:hypothetical protein
MFGTLFIRNGGVDASQPQDRVSWMAIGQYYSVGRSQPGKIIATLEELVGALTYRRAVFRNRLIKAHRHPAAAIAVENYSAHWLNVPEMVHSLRDVQRYQLPVNQSFVVLESGVHTEDHKSPS